MLYLLDLSAFETLCLMDVFIPYVNSLLLIDIPDPDIPQQPQAQNHFSTHSLNVPWNVFMLRFVVMPSEVRPLS